VFLLLLILLAPPKDALSTGAFDWARRRVRVLGVGRPIPLSPTASLSSKEFYQLARADALERMERALQALPLDADRLAGIFSKARIQEAALELEAVELLRFSDGTVHLHAELPFEVLLGVSSPPKAKGAGLIIQLKGPPHPAVRLQLQDAAGARRWAGLPEDPLSGPVIWTQDPDRAQQHAGLEPLRLEAQALDRPGLLLLEQLPPPRAGGISIYSPKIKPKRKRKNRSR